jgi:hypothetical protein
MGSQMLTYAIRRSGNRGPTCSSPPGPASPCWSSGGGKSGSVASASGAGSVGVDPPAADGSGAGAAVAGPTPEDSARVDDPGAEVVVSGFSWRFTALAALMKSSSLLYKSKRSEYLLCNQMQTYSVDFFLTAFFTRMARCRVSVAGGGV